MTDVLDPGVPAHATALRLLDERIIAWFTTVDARGRPHAVPVWFFWHDGRVVVFSRHDSVKVAHVRRGSPVLVHLDTGRFGSEVVILHGTATVSDRDAASWLDDFREGYERKHAEAIADYGMPLDDIVATFSAAIVFTPERVLTW
jgi:PPOX class probable F420-dependent enzyme